MKLIVAEKSSAAGEIAKVIGADKYYDGAYHGNGYIVSCAVGHLVEFKEPAEYDEKFKKWRLADLPIVPNFEFKASKNTLPQLKKLKELMNSKEVDEIIEATDAGREGECIFRYIKNFVNCKKPCKRLWISSLTAGSIKRGFENLKPMSEYDNLFAAGFARAKIDWLFGINLSRLYSLYSNATIPIGRVKTAVVNMIVMRDNEIDGFVKKPFYKLKLSNGAEWFDGEGDCFSQRLQAEKIKEKCSGKQCTVISAETVLKKEKRPLLYSLTSLQADANEKYGFSAADTLNAVQSLYEKKLTTYPRTDSNYITDDMAPEIAERVKMLRPFAEKTVDSLMENGLNIDSRVVNNNKVSDHHAIIPTENILNYKSENLNDTETKILNMIVTRFLAVLCGEYEYNETEFIFDVEGEKFKIKQKYPFKFGWKALYSDNEKTAKQVISYHQGDTFITDELIISECETAPPKAFTEASLLRAMENIDRRIEDKKLSGFVSERGLGTPATRAEIIEGIIHCGYVERKGKILRSTEFGKKTIAMLPESVKNIELTAQMEQELARIERGELSAADVVLANVKQIDDIIKKEKNREHISFGSERTVIGTCPKCSGKVFISKTKDNKIYYFCENSTETSLNNCNFWMYSDDYFWSSKHKVLGSDIMKSLLKNGEVKVSGFYSSSTGKTYDAYVSFCDRTDKNGNPRVGFVMHFNNKKG